MKWPKISEWDQPSTQSNGGDLTSYWHIWDYCKEVRRKWGKVLLVTDNASQHKHREVRQYLEEHDGLEILYLPATTPKLGAVESVWKGANYRLVTSEHYETLEGLTHALSEYL